MSDPYSPFNNNMRPVEEVKTVCRACSNDQDRRWGGPGCLKAKVLGIDRVSGRKDWESNYQKNDGNCPDFEAKPVPAIQHIPPGITAAYEAGPAPRRSIWDRISDAWSELVSQ